MPVTSPLWAPNRMVGKPGHGLRTLLVLSKSIPGIRSGGRRFSLATLAASQPPERFVVCLGGLTKCEIGSCWPQSTMDLELLLKEITP